MSTIARVSKQPVEVIAACIAIGASSLIACVVDLFFLLDRKPHIGGPAVIVAITALIIWGLLRRLNWLRWLMVVLIAIGLALTVLAIVSKGVSVFLPLYYVQALIQAVAALLLVLPLTNRWYTSR